MKHTRLFALLLCVLLLCGTLPAFAAPQEDAPELYSKSAIVYGLNAGNVILEKDADRVSAPASLTKIATAMTVLDLCDDPDHTRVTVPGGLFDEITAVGGSNIELQPGEVLTVTQLLYAVILPSACDACNVLAYHFGNGSIDAFVAEMNRWAKEAGAEHTNFVNAHGLDEAGHVSTARDISKMILCALKNDRFNRIIRTDELIIPETEYHEQRYINYQSTIPMLYPYNSGYYEGMIGIKSGYTLEALCCLSSMAERGGERFLVVCMGATREPENRARTDTAALYDWAFANFETRSVKRAGEAVKTVALESATTTEAVLTVKEDFSVCCRKNAGEITLSVEAPDPASPPFEETAGRLIASADGEAIAEAPLVWQTPPVALPTAGGEAEATDGANNTPVLLAAIAVCVALLLFAMALLFLARPKKKKGRPAPQNRPAPRPPQSRPPQSRPPRQG